MQLNVLNDLAKAKRRRTEKKLARETLPNSLGVKSGNPFGNSSDLNGLFFVAGALCLSAGHHFETYSSTTSRSRLRTRGESIRG